MADGNMKRLREYHKVLVDLLDIVPAYISCNELHHAKKDRHDYHEECPVQQKYETIRARAAHLAARGIIIGLED